MIEILIKIVERPEGGRRVVLVTYDEEKSEPTALETQNAHVLGRAFTEAMKAAAKSALGGIIQERD